MILGKVEHYCTDILSKLQLKLPFHNLYHTQSVVSNVKHICTYMNYPQADIERIMIAAWFHDLGHMHAYKEHELISIQSAHDFLLREGVDQEMIDQVSQAIMATQLPQNPLTDDAKVLCDADLFHLGSPDYFYWQMLLRREWEIVLNKTFSNLEWHQLNHEFLSQHEFHTPFGKEVLSRQRDKNIKKIENILSVCA